MSRLCPMDVTCYLFMTYFKTELTALYTCMCDVTKVS